MLRSGLLSGGGRISRVPERVIRPFYRVEAGRTDEARGDPGGVWDARSTCWQVAIVKPGVA